MPNRRDRLGVGVIVLQPGSDKPFGSFAFWDRMPGCPVVRWRNIDGGINGEIEAIGDSCDWRKL